MFLGFILVLQSKDKRIDLIHFHQHRYRKMLDLKSLWKRLQLWSVESKCVTPKCMCFCMYFKVWYGFTWPINPARKLCSSRTDSICKLELQMDTFLSEFNWNREYVFLWNCINKKREEQSQNRTSFYCHPTVVETTVNFRIIKNSWSKSAKYLNG